MIFGRVTMGGERKIYRPSRTKSGTGLPLRGRSTITIDTYPHQAPVFPEADPMPKIALAI